MIYEKDFICLDDWGENALYCLFSDPTMAKIRLYSVPKCIHRNTV